MSILLRGKKSLSQLARAILRSFGSNASSYPFSTLQGAYQTSAGPAAAAVNDPVGLELDAMGAVGPELNAHPGPFTATTGYAYVGVTPSAVSGSLVITNISGGVGQANYSMAMDAGKTYLLEFSIMAGAVNSVPQSARIQTTIDAVLNVQTAVDTNGVPKSFFQYISSPIAATLKISLQIASAGAAGGAGDTASASLMSVKEVTGNHATQTTAINRPTVQRGLWNLLTYSQDFSHWIWVKSEITISNAVLIPSVVSITHPAVQNSFTIPGGTATFAAIVSAAGYVKVGFRESATTGYWSTFELSIGAVIGNHASVTNATITSIGSGKYLITQTISATTTQGFCIHVMDAGYVSGSPNNYAFSGDGVSGVSVHSAGLFQGTLTAAQILQQGGIPLTTSAAGSNPTAGPYWASFNGVNQYTVSPAGGGASTAFFLCAAFQTLAAGVAQTLWSDRSGNTGLKLEITAGNVIQFSGGNGASIINSTGDAVTPGSAYVVTAKYNGTSLSVQLNNAAAVTAACALSAGTAAITIGADPSGASGFFNGGFYDMPFIKNGLPTAAQEATIKSATGQRAGLTI